MSCCWPQVLGMADKSHEMVTEKAFVLGNPAPAPARRRADGAHQALSSPAWQGGAGSVPAWKGSQGTGTAAGHHGETNFSIHVVESNQDRRSISVCFMASNKAESGDLGTRAPDQEDKRLSTVFTQSVK